jgi:hypothetical protein
LVGVGVAIIPASVELVDLFDIQLSSTGRWLLTVLTVTASGIAVGAAVNTLVKEKAPALGPARRLAIVIGALTGLAILTAVFIGLRDPFAAIPRMTGTQDVASIGFIRADGTALAPSSDLSDGLVQQLQPALRYATVRSYASLNAPLDGLLHTDHTGLRDWTDEFLTRSGAAIVVAGVVDDAGAQISVRPAIYVRPSSIPESPELMDWVVGPSSIVVGGLDSTRGRQSLFDSFIGSGTTVAAFVDALDAWRVGHIDEAARLFTALPTDAPGGLLSADLVHLFRGHAIELQAQADDTARHGALLSAAADEYNAIAHGSPMAGRALVSLATNEYLRAIGNLCSHDTVNAPLLLSSVEHLKAQTANESLPTISRLAALLNYAQANRCAVRAGLSADTGSSSTALRTIRNFIATDAIIITAVQRIQALARSIEAQATQESGDLAAANQLIQEAISLTGDPSDRGRWYGLLSLWQQQACHLPEARQSLDLSLQQYREAAKNQRITSDYLDRYTKAAEGSLATATGRCH